MCMYTTEYQLDINIACCQMNIVYIQCVHVHESILIIVYFYPHSLVVHMHFLNHNEEYVGQIPNGYVR